MIQLNEGDKAPIFKGKDQNGNEVTLNDFAGKKLILFFYPKDNTPGCTAEACNLRDNYQVLKDKGFEILGISPDSEKSHQNFITKKELPYNLIADTEKEILTQFGVWGEKKMYGRVYDGVHRTTFIISEDGNIEKVIKKVKTKDHAQQIVDDLGL